MTVSDLAKAEVILCNEFFHPFTRLGNEGNHLFIKPIYQGQLYLRCCASSEGTRPCRDGCWPQGAESPVGKTDESGVTVRYGDVTERQRYDRDEHENSSELGATSPVRSGHTWVLQPR